MAYRPDVDALNRNPQILAAAKTLAAMPFKGFHDPAHKAAADYLYSLGVPRPQGNDTWAIDPSTGALTYNTNRGETAAVNAGKIAAITGGALVGGGILAPYVLGAAGPVAGEVGGATVGTGTGVGLGTGAAATSPLLAASVPGATAAGFGAVAPTVAAGTGAASAAGAGMIPTLAKLGLGVGTSLLGGRGGGTTDPTIARLLPQLEQMFAQSARRQTATDPIYDAVLRMVMGQLPGWSREGLAVSNVPQAAPAVPRASLFGRR